MASKSAALFASVLFAGARFAGARCAGARFAGVALIATAMAAACSDQAPTKVSPPPQKAALLTDPKAIVEAAADPCTAAKGLFLTSLCGHPDLKDLTAQIKSTLIAEGANIDVAAATTLRDGQQGWIAATRIYCGIDDAAGVLTADQLGCVKAQLQLRVKKAASIIEDKNGLVFQRVEFNEAIKPQAAAQSGPSTPMDDLPITKEIDYPRLNSATPQAAAFNALMQATVQGLRPPPSEDSARTTEAISYEITFAGADLVSVMFNSSQSSPGAMHTEKSVRVANVVMATGKELTAADVFAAPEARWQAELVRRASAGLRRQLRDLRGVEISQSDIRDTVTKPHNWRITDRALVLVIPPGSVGPPQLGVVLVEAAWRDLKALLKPDAPAPIKQS
jgi:hypothetical protein